MDEVQRLATTLRGEHRQPEDRVSFTHIPVTLTPRQVLESLRHSDVADLLAAQGAPLTHPERPWYDPILLITANDDDLVAAGITASTWERPAWDHEAGELVVWLAYEIAGARAQQRLTLHSTTAGLTLSRAFYDEQRAETGYEGEDHLNVTPTDKQVADFLAVVRAATGVA